MTVMKSIHRACNPEEFLFQFRLVQHWSLPSLPWENPPDVWMVQHLDCADRLTLSWEAWAKLRSAGPHRRRGVVGSGLGSAAVSIPAFGRVSAVGSGLPDAAATVG